jgi:hypothetical protein
MEERRRRGSRNGRREGEGPGEGGRRAAVEVGLFISRALPF